MTVQLEQNHELQEGRLLPSEVHKEELIESIVLLLKKADVHELDLIYRMAKNMIV